MVHGGQHQNGAEQHEKGYPICLFYIDTEAIQSIILGAEASDELVSEVEQQLDRHRLDHVSIQRARLNRHAHTIDIVPHVLI